MPRTSLRRVPATFRYSQSLERRGELLKSLAERPAIRLYLLNEAAEPIDDRNATGAHRLSGDSSE